MRCPAAVPAVACAADVGGLAQSRTLGAEAVGPKSLLSVANAAAAAWH